MNRMVKGRASVRALSERPVAWIGEKCVLNARCCRFFPASPRHVLVPNWRLQQPQCDNTKMGIVS